MGMFLNSRAPYEMYKKIVQNPYFVDKSLLLTELLSSFDSINCYCCITRPRRFGKTIMANRTSSGPYDELFYYVRHNIEEVRDDLALMVSGERVPADIGQFSAVSMEINSRGQIYSAMVFYGLLTYENGEVFIPNKELMDYFRIGNINLEAGKTSCYHSSF